MPIANAAPRFIIFLLFLLANLFLFAISLGESSIFKALKKSNNDDVVFEPGVWEI